MKINKAICIFVCLCSFSSFSVLAAEISERTVDSKPIATTQLDLNKVNAEQLKVPKLIGKKRAQAIIKWREAKGGINSFQELENAKDLNIGKSVIKALKKRFYIK